MRVRTRDARAICSTGSSRSPPVPDCVAAVSGTPAARATSRHAAYVASASAAVVRCPDRLPIAASSVRSAWARTASPARMPSAVRSSWVCSSCSIHRSSVVISRYCWSTMLCHSAGSISRSAAASAPYSEPYCTLPGGTCIQNTSSSVGAAARSVAIGAWNSTDRLRPTPSARAYSSGLVVGGTYCGLPYASYDQVWVLAGWYSSRRPMRRTTQSRSGRATSVCAGPDTGPSTSEPASSRPR